MMKTLPLHKRFVCFLRWVLIIIVLPLLILFQAFRANESIAVDVYVGNEILLGESTDQTCTVVASKGLPYAAPTN